jgi:hypothetical protein
LRQAIHHTRDLPLRVCRWHNVSLPERGTISILDARDADDSAPVQVQDELEASIRRCHFFLEEEQTARESEGKFDELITYLNRNNASAGCKNNRNYRFPDGTANRIRCYRHRCNPAEIGAPLEPDAPRARFGSFEFVSGTRR